MTDANTIYALSSGRPPAAIAIIRISGPAAMAAAQAQAGALPEPRHAAVRRLTDATGELLDEALVLVFPGPNSATGEDLVEFHCHGGRAVVDGVLAALGGDPCLRLAEPGEFTRRALMNGRIDLTEAEGLADLLAAETESQRRAALRVAGGALRRQVDAWRERLLMLSVEAEAAIDYASDEDETAVDVSGLVQRAQTLASDMRGWLDQPRAEILRDGIKVVIAGPPNSGKSSLLNALSGHDKAIVTPVPGTTRDVIDVPVAIDGVPLRLIDTAGLRVTQDVVEALGVARAEEEVRDADIVLWLGDETCELEHPHVLALHSRCDEAGRTDMVPDRIACSSRTGEGLRELKAMLVARASTMLPPDEAVVLNRRQASRIAEARDSLGGIEGEDLALTADAFRRARASIDSVSGYAGIEDLLGNLFGRFCLGK